MDGSERSASGNTTGGDTQYNGSSRLPSLEEYALPSFLSPGMAPLPRAGQSLPLLKDKPLEPPKPNIASPAIVSPFNRTLPPPVVDAGKTPTEAKPPERPWRFNQETAQPKDNKMRNDWMNRNMDKLLSMGVGSLKFDSVPNNAEPRFWRDEQGHYLYFKNYGDQNKKYQLSKQLSTLEICGQKFDLDKIRADIDNQVRSKREAHAQADSQPDRTWSFQSKKLDANTEVVAVYDSSKTMRFQQIWKGGNLSSVVECDAFEKPAVKMYFGVSGLAKIEIRDLQNTWNTFQKRGDRWQPADSHNGRKLEEWVKPYYLRKPG